MYCGEGQIYGIVDHIQMLCKCVWVSLSPHQALSLQHCCNLWLGIATMLHIKLVTFFSSNADNPILGFWTMHMEKYLDFGPHVRFHA